MFLGFFSSCSLGGGAWGVRLTPVLDAPLTASRTGAPGRPAWRKELSREGARVFTRGMEPATHSIAPQRTVAPTQQELLPSFLHDLNNLLGIVLGNAELLLDPAVGEEKRDKRTQAIYTAAAKARDLVANLQRRMP